MIYYFGIDAAVPYEFLCVDKKDGSAEFSFSFECCSDSFAGVKLLRINQSKAIGRAIHSVLFCLS